MKYLLALIMLALIIPIEGFSEEKNSAQLLSESIFKERLPKEKYETIISKFSSNLLNKTKINIPCKEIKKQYEDEVSNHLNSSFNYEKFIETLSRTMSNNFTEGELSTILEFYKTDAGKKASKFDNGFKMIVNQHLSGYVQSSYIGLTPIYIKYSDSENLCQKINKEK